MTTATYGLLYYVFTSDIDRYYVIDLGKLHTHNYCSPLLGTVKSQNGTNKNSNNKKDANNYLQIS